MKNTIFALAALACAAATAEFREVESLPLTARTGYKTFVETIPCQIGNYDVTLVFGDAEKPTASYVRFEGRRVASGKIETAPGETKTFTFTARVKGPIAGESYVNGEGKTREAPFPHALNITVATTAGKPPRMETAPAPDSRTIYLCGDSTVTDQQSEPWGSWGQCLPAFFGKGAAVANFARSGLSTRTFVNQGRLTRIIESVKPGDWVLVQFGHNDQKSKNLQPGGGYDEYLQQFIDRVRIAGANIAIVSPVERLRFDRKGRQQPKTLDDYAAAAKRIADKNSVPFIDLNDASYRMYGALGAKGSEKILCYFTVEELERDFFGNAPRADGKNTRDIKDRTHHSLYGAYVLAHLVADELARQVPELAALRRPGVPPMDAANPDPDPAIPPTGFADATRPAGDR